MRFVLTDHITDKGEGACNEDLAGLGDQLAWVIDGATDVYLNTYLPGITDARWLVERLDGELRRAEAELTMGDLPALYGRLAEYVRLELAAVDYPKDRLPPACSCGIARPAPGQGIVELALVGDVYLLANPSRDLLSNPYFSKREAAGVRQARIRNGGSGLELVHKDREQIAMRRRGYLRGTDGNFVLSNNPDVVRGVRTKNVAVRPGDSLLLCTDGLARLVEGYKVYESWATLSDVVAKDGLSAVLDELRAYERSHTRSEQNYKASDDVCAMVLTIG